MRSPCFISRWRDTRSVLVFIEVAPAISLKVRGVLGIFLMMVRSFDITLPERSNDGVLFTGKVDFQFIDESMRGKKRKFFWKRERGFQKLGKIPEVIEIAGLCPIMKRVDFHSQQSFRGRDRDEWGKAAQMTL